jgi:hypothetical protein
MSDMLLASRRDLLIAPLLVTIPGALWDECANASPIDPNMTFKTGGPDRPADAVRSSAQNRRAGATLG